MLSRAPTHTIASVRCLIHAGEPTLTGACRMGMAVLPDAKVARVLAARGPVFERACTRTKKLLYEHHATA